MQVVGVLEPSYTADDGAIFVDLKTAWVIQGLVHGHQDMDGLTRIAGGIDEIRIQKDIADLLIASEGRRHRRTTGNGAQSVSAGKCQLRVNGIDKTWQ